MSRPWWVRRTGWSTRWTSSPHGAARCSTSSWRGSVPGCRASTIEARRHHRTRRTRHRAVSRPGRLRRRGEPHARQRGAGRGRLAIAESGTVGAGEMSAHPRACAIARDLLVGEHAVSRVIARPFAGKPGAYERTPRRKDFSIEPVGTTLLDRLAAAGVPRVGIGKVDDLFAGRNIASEHTPTNADAYRLIERALEDKGAGFIFVNVIEFDQTWGHRNDVPGFHEGLQQLDAWIPRLEARVKGDDLIILTADHGNDPTTPSTDHSREAVPILALGPRVRAQRR